jgi:hypothetical protein
MRLYVEARTDRKLDTLSDAEHRADSLCPVCGDVKTGAKHCNACTPTHSPDRVVKSTPGRPRSVTDEQILNAIEAGARRADQLLRVLPLSHKSNLMRRLSDLEAQGLVSITRRTRKEGYTFTSLRDVPDAPHQGGDAA